MSELHVFIILGVHGLKTNEDSCPKSYQAVCAPKPNQVVFVSSFSSLSTHFIFIIAKLAVQTCKCRAQELRIPKPFQIPALQKSLRCILKLYKYLIAVVNVYAYLHLHIYIDIHILKMIFHFKSDVTVLFPDTPYFS